MNYGKKQAPKKSYASKPAAKPRAKTKKKAGK